MLYVQYKEITNLTFHFEEAFNFHHTAPEAATDSTVVFIDLIRINLGSFLHQYGNANGTRLENVCYRQLNFNDIINASSAEFMQSCAQTEVSYKSSFPIACKI